MVCLGRSLMAAGLSFLGMVVTGCGLCGHC